MQLYVISGTKGLTVDFRGKKYVLLENIYWEDYGFLRLGSAFYKYALDYTPDDLEYYGRPISCEAQCQPVDAAGQDCENFNWTACFTFTKEEYDQCSAPEDFLKFLDGIVETEYD